MKDISNNLYYDIDFKMYDICTHSYPYPILLWLDFFIIKLDAAQNKFYTPAMLETDE